MTELKIDPEFRDKIPPLIEAEFKQLEENINAYNHGIPDAAKI